MERLTQPVRPRRVTNKPGNSGAINGSLVTAQGHRGTGGEDRRQRLKMRVQEDVCEAMRMALADGNGANNSLTLLHLHVLRVL